MSFWKNLKESLEEIGEGYYEGVREAREKEEERNRQLSEGPEQTQRRHKLEQIMSDYKRELRRLGISGDLEDMAYAMMVRTYGVEPDYDGDDHDDDIYSLRYHIYLNCRSAYSRLKPTDDEKVYINQVLKDEYNKRVESLIEIFAYNDANPKLLEKFKTEKLTPSKWKELALEAGYTKTHIIQVDNMIKRNDINHILYYQYGILPLDPKKSDVL